MTNDRKIAKWRRSRSPIRLEHLDLEPFQVAPKVLGAVVPDIKVIQDEELENEDIRRY